MIRCVAVLFLSTRCRTWKKKKENSTDDCLAERQQQQQKALTASNVFSNSLRARMTAPPWLRCSSFLFSNLSYVSNAIYLLFLLSIGQCCMSRSQTQYIKKKKKKKEPEIIKTQAKRRTTLWSLFLPLRRTTQHDFYHCDLPTKKTPVDEANQMIMKAP